MYDMAHEPAWAEIMSYREDKECCSILLRPPTEKAHWHEKWRAIHEGINAHLIAAIAEAQRSPGGAIDAAPIAALCRSGACLRQPAANDAYHARAVRRS